MPRRSGGRSQMMQLSEFRDLIEIMPVSFQASTSKRSTWEKHLLENNKASEALRSILDAFGPKDMIILSRRDLLYLARKSSLERFVMATIVWGYTSGGRGKNVANLMSDLAELTGLLSEARDHEIADWKKHYEAVETIKGIGLSTYSKFLNFLSVKVDGDQALILDDRIIRVLSQDVWQELCVLRELSKNPVRSYPKYLKEMRRIANSLEVSAEALEFFLFEFGLNLKSQSTR